MGNKIDDKNNDAFIKAVSQIKKQRNDHPVQKVSTHPEEKYKEHMLDVLRKQQMPKAVKKSLADCIQKKIKKQDLTSTISVLNSLRSNNAQQLLKSSIPLGKAANQTKYVVVKFDQRKPKHMKKENKSLQRESASSTQHYMSIRQQDTLEGRIKYTGQFICKQLNKPYHPFRYLCKRFADILYSYKQSETAAQNQDQYDLKQEVQRKSVKEFALYLGQGCLGVYRKWIMEYTGLEQKKYDKWIYSLCLNQMWGVNQGLLATSMHDVIRKTKVPLKIDVAELSACSVIGVIQPKDFAIDSQLQIAGHYFTSIFNMSALTQKKKPTDVLKQLDAIKNSICMDIDNFHKLEQKGQIFQINGDNMMGIVSYVMSKVSDKISQISVILLFLKVVYGDDIYCKMDNSSYMYCTIWSAVEHLEERKFQLPKQDGSDQRVVDKQLKDTSCVSSASFTSSKPQ